VVSKAVRTSIKVETAAIDGFTWYISVEKIFNGKVSLNVDRKKVMINSSNEIIKLKIPPPIRPGAITGKVTCHRARNEEAPRLRAASSKEILKVCRLAVTVTTTKGTVIVRCAGMKDQKLSEIPNSSAMRKIPSPSTICGKTIGDIRSVYSSRRPRSGPRFNPSAAMVPITRDNGVTIRPSAKLNINEFCQFSDLKT
tara:strand:- start:159 stop:749 length:591 start_codon:yes stop_codon:yes gene_type:complete